MATTPTAEIDEDVELTYVDEEAPEELEEVDIDGEDLVDDVVDVPWHGVIAMEGVPTADGREFAQNALTTRPLPIPLLFQPMTDGVPHGKAVVVGNITEAWKEGSEFRARGTFWAAEPMAQRVIDGVASGFLGGVSIDLDEMEIDQTKAKADLLEMFKRDRDSFLEAEDAKPVEPPTDEELAEQVEAIFAQPDVTMFTKGRVAAATMVPIPAFEQVYIALGGAFEDELTDEDRAALTACGCAQSGTVDGERPWIDDEQWDSLVQEALTAAGGTFAPGTHDGPGWITAPKATARIRRYWTHGKGAAKIRWGQPGDFNRCRKQLAKYVKNPEWLAGTCANMHKEALGIWPATHAAKGKHEGAVDIFAMTASAGGELPPRAWFENPQLDEITPMVITSDGRVYGHLAQWGTCHIGMDGICMQPPRNHSSYAYWHKGVFDTDDGPVGVGNLTFGIGHASVRVSMERATAHYDKPDAVRAYVRVGEDAHGIWFAGVLREDLTAKQLREFKALGSLSGDWRWVNGALELISATSVNTPGFSLPEQPALVASGGVQMALVAAGIVVRHPEEQAAMALTPENVAAIARTAVDEYRAEEARAGKLAAVKPVLDRIRSQRVAEAKSRITKGQ